MDSPARQCHRAQQCFYTILVLPVLKKPLSPRRDEIFQPLDKPRYLLNGDRFPDLYTLLETPRDATRRALEEAIVEATSQLLAVNFSRGMTPRLRLVERFTPDFRLLLLDPKRRARYDALLLAHERGDQTAPPYAAFLAGEEGESLLQRARRRAKTVGERLVVTWRDSPYI